jgi:hypothetical protein
MDEFADLTPSTGRFGVLSDEPPTSGGRAVPVSVQAPRIEESSPPHDPEAVRARRELLAKKLGRGRPGSLVPPAAPSAPPSRDRAHSIPPAQAAEDLRKRLADRRAAALRLQITKYIEAASSALSRGDPASAANAYRLALNLSPDDLQLKSALKDAQTKASEQLCEGYLRQAEYEERAERWADAARSYIRAAEGMRSNALVQSKAAATLLRAGTDLHRIGVSASCGGIGAA